MNSDTLTGATTELGGRIKDGLGEALGDRTLQSEGKADRTAGAAQRAYGDAKSAIEDTVQPLIDYARQFMRERPFTAAALGGVLGIALINTLRGK